MKRRMLSVLFGVLLLLPAVAVAAPGYISQLLTVRFDLEAHRMTARAEMRLGGKDPSWPDGFLLAPHAEIDKVMLDGDAAAFEFSRGRLSIEGVQHSAEVVVSYSILYDDPVPRDFVGMEDPSYGIDATIMPQGVFLSERSGWHLYAPGTLQKFMVRIVGEELLTGVTSGRLEAHERGPGGTVTTWQTGAQHSALTLAAGHYRLSREMQGGVQLLVFLTERNRALAEGYLESVRDYLAFYQKLLGPYPYEKFAVVENFYPTGYGLPGWTLLGSSVVRLPFIRTTSLPHEVVHAWWGNAVEVDYASGNWAEGLATYLADYYLKEVKEPREAVEYRRKLLRDYAALAAEDNLPLVDFQRRATKRDQAIGYGKAAMVFHMLRQLIGDEAFWGALETAATEGFDRRFSWDDLRLHFERASGENLEGFFRQWVIRSGAPLLSLADVNVVKAESAWQVSGLLRQDAPIYDLAVPLVLDAGGREYEQVVGLAQAEDCFFFTVAERPVALAVDPDNMLFRKLYDEELPATVNSLRASRNPLVVVAAGAQPLLEASRDLLRGLQWRDVDMVTEEAYLDTAPAGRDVLMLGMPEDAGLRAGLAAVQQNMDTHAKELLGGEGRTLFVVSPATSGTHVIAYFIPASIASAQDVARRIPHYGRYSYLVFERGNNRVKATWEPKDSRLSVFFAKETTE